MDRAGERVWQCLCCGSRFTIGGGAVRWYVYVSCSPACMTAGTREGGTVRVSPAPSRTPNGSDLSDEPTEAER